MEKGFLPASCSLAPPSLGHNRTGERIAHKTLRRRDGQQEHATQARRT